MTTPHSTDSITFDFRLLEISLRYRPLASILGEASYKAPAELGDQSLNTADIIQILTLEHQHSHNQ